MSATPEFWSAGVCLCHEKTRQNRSPRGRDEEPIESLRAQLPVWRHHAPEFPAIRTYLEQTRSSWRSCSSPHPLPQMQPAVHSDRSLATTSADQCATCPKSILFSPYHHPLRRCTLCIP